VNGIVKGIFGGGCRKTSACSQGTKTVKGRPVGAGRYRAQLIQRGIGKTRGGGGGKRETSFGGPLPNHMGQDWG